VGATARVAPRVITLVEGSPDIFKKSNVSPRSLEYASKILVAREQNGHGNTPDGLLIATLAGLVGEATAVALVRLLKKDTRPLSAEDVLIRYASLRAVVMAAGRTSRLDLIRATLLALQGHLQRQQAWEDVQADDEQRANLDAFLKDIPPDLRKAFDEWAVERGYAAPARRRRARS